MRKTTALLALLAMAIFWTGCASDKGSSNSSPANSAATNSAAPESSGATNANKNSYGTPKGASAPPTTAATPASSGGIKPPMKNENQ